MLLLVQFLCVGGYNRLLCRDNSLELAGVTLDLMCALLCGGRKLGVTLLPNGVVTPDFV